MAKKIVIIGGVAGGASTAARLRRLDEMAEIVLLERGEHVSYANCGLPYYIGEVIKDRNRLFVMTKERFSQWFQIDVRVHAEALSIDRQGRRVEIENKITGARYFESYDYLVLSPGAEPIRPPIAGIDHPHIFTLRNVPETDRVYQFIQREKPESAVVVGGGFIGVEMAENLRKRGIAVTLVEAAPHILPFLDEEPAAMVQNYLREQGVTLHLADGVTGFAAGTKRAVSVALNSGHRTEADFVILAIGVRPEIGLAREAGLAIGRGIEVNEYLQTSDPHIYALGDAIDVTEYVTGVKASLPLAGPANKQGRIVANNIAGRSEKYRGTQGTAVLKIFELVAAATGVSESILKKAGLPYHTCIIHPSSHAGYYPGSKQMLLKLIFGQAGQIYGAQAVGFAGIDKRIDVIAAAIRLQKTVYDLQELELTYAPPFSSAKDPVNMAGYVAGNVLQGDVDLLSLQELLAKEQATYQLVDVRELQEYEQGAIPGAVHIPLGQLRQQLSRLNPVSEVVVYCAVGLRSYLASRILSQRGFKRVKSLNGGYRLYQIITVNRQKS